MMHWTKACFNVAYNVAKGECQLSHERHQSHKAQGVVFPEGKTSHESPTANHFVTCISLPLTSVCANQTRQKSSYVNKWMRRDVKRRALVKEHNDERIRLNAIRKNKILPKELQEQADLDITQLPRDAFPIRMHKRCVITSRARGLVNRYRLSRIQWRLFADYNKLSGVTRSAW